MMSKFVSGESEMVIKYITTIFIKEIIISHFIIHSQLIEEEKRKD